MDYKNEICQGCSAPFSEDDDIVVCPVCGTPQHRLCWQKSNDCVNAHMHCEGYVWQKSIETEPDPQAEKEPEKESKPVPNVFTQLSQEAQNLEAVFLREQVAHKQEEIDGIEISDMGYYLQSGAHRYIKRFRKNKKLTWNWGAFAFSPAWFFYRKLYKVGAIFLTLVVAVNLFLFSYAQGIAIELEEVYTVMENSLEKTGDAAQTGELLFENSDFLEKYISVLKKSGIYFLLTVFVPNVVAALTGDIFVKKKMKKDIENVKSSGNDAQFQRSLVISKGGVAPLIFAAVFFAESYIVPFLINIGNMFTELF